MTAIRRANLEDREAVRKINLAAFPAGENQVIAGLGEDLLVAATQPETLTLVADHGGCVAGFVAFSPLSFEPDTPLSAYLLAPLCVDPLHQGSHIGTRLVRFGLEQLRHAGVDVVLVYGDPRYYGRFGFEAETASVFIPPYALEFPFGWLAVMLGARNAPGKAVTVNCVAALRKPELW